jgi:capsular exopolysaccharide synthesis family protein
MESPELEQADGSSVRSGPSLMQVAWQRKSLVILGLIIGLVLGLLYYAQKQPVYLSTSQMLVVKRTPNDTISLGSGESRLAYMEDYMSTQSILVKSPAIIGRAVKMPNLHDLKSFPGERQDNIIYMIQQHLTVGRDNRDNQSGQMNNILTLMFRGPEADECQKILESIMTSYQGFLDETYKDVSEKTFELIREAQRILKEDLMQADQAWADFRMKNPMTIFGRAENGSSNIYLQRLNAIERKRSEKKIEKLEKQEQLRTIKRVLAESGDAAARHQISLLKIKLAFSDAISDSDKKVAELEMMKKQASATFGPKHPQIRQIDDQIQFWRERLSRPSSPVGPNGNSAKPVGPASLDSVESCIQALEAEVVADDAMIKHLDDEWDVESKTAKEFSNQELNDDRLRNAVVQQRQLLDTINKRLSEISLGKDFGGYNARRIAEPNYGKKVAPSAITVFPIAGFGGLLLGLCLAYLAEMSDKSFRNPAEIRRRLGLPVVGHIPFFMPDEKAQKQIAIGEPGIDPMLCTHYASNSVSAEAYRSVRTAIYFNTQGIGHQVIQITSPNMADGKSTLATNLAVSMAQSGKKTILIDADCRRPRIHKLMNVSNESGLASVIAGQSDLATAIKPTAIPNLALLPCGPRPANPAELLTSPRFKELLDIIRAQYDYVLVDTPPLLVVTDPCVVAPRVDGVLLAIRVTKNGRPFAERAKEIISSLGANVLGVVVNGLGGQAGGRYGYGYDSYNYGAGYNYTYRYSYTYTDAYTDDKASSYYSAPDSPEMPLTTPPGASATNEVAIQPEPTPTVAPTVVTTTAPTVVQTRPVTPDDDESLPPS